MSTIKTDHIGLLLNDPLHKETPENLLFTGVSGVPERIRTFDLQSRSLSLYPAELRVHDNYLNVYITTGLQRRSLTLYPAELRVPV